MGIENYFASTMHIPDFKPIPLEARLYFLSVNNTIKGIKTVVDRAEAELRENQIVSVVIYNQIGEPLHIGIIKEESFNSFSAEGNTNDGKKAFIVGNISTLQVFVSIVDKIPGERNPIGFRAEFTPEKPAVEESTS